MKRLEDSIIKVHEKVGELIRRGSCEERTGMVTFCIYFKESGCQETCTYAKRKSLKLNY